MIQRAGIASFYLPDNWDDYSIYSYQSPNELSKITIFIENFPTNLNPEDLINEKIDEIESSGFEIKIIQNISDVNIRNTIGKMLIFEIEDSDLPRNRLLALIPDREKSVLVLAQSTNHSDEIESFWNELIASFLIAGETENI